MGKTEERYIKDKYGSFGKYNDVIDNILESNRTTMGNEITTITADTWGKALQELDVGAPVIMPTKSTLRPTKKEIQAEARADGQLMSKNLRNGLSKKLFDGLQQWMDETKQSGYLTKKGELRGKMPKSLIGKFEEMIVDTFDGYTRRGKAVPVPPNIHTIAITETRLAVNKAKHKYVENFKLHNPRVKVKKRWIHNDYLVKEPRPGHKRLHGQVLPLNRMFIVQTFIQVKGMYIRSGEIEMAHPHDPRAPVSEVANCQCELEYVMEG